MIVLFCTLFVIGLCRCNVLPSKNEVESSINRTIDEVERLIRENSTLPHLTRREIIDILFNITSKDLDTYQSKKTIEEARSIYQKALMVVLPYNAEDARENIKDLYTKPPIVQLLADSSSKLEDFEEWKNKKLQGNMLVQETQHNKQSSHENSIITYAPEKNLSKENSPAQTRYKNHGETSSEAPSKMPLKELDSTPVKFSFNLENLEKQPILAKGPATTTRRPVFAGSSLNEKKEVYIVYSTSATTIPPRTAGTKKANVSMSNLGLDLTSRPSKYNGHVLSVDQWRYNAPTTQSTVTKLPETVLKNTHDEHPLLPAATTHISLGDVAPISKIKYTPEISKVTTEKMPIVSDEKSAPIFVTPTAFSSPSSSPSSSSDKLKYSTYNSNSGGFRRITTTTTTTSTTMRPEVMDLLASIGLRPENATNVEDVFKRNKEREDLKIKSQIPNSNGLVHATSGLTAVAPDSSSVNIQNTFETPVSEIDKGMNNLTPDVQLLFQRFGLQTSNLATTTTSTLKSTSNTNSYTNFKPLPTSRIKNEDMKEFLAQFGLGVSNSRQKKAMSAERPSLIEVVPDNMRQILENIGLVSRKREISTTPKMETEPTKATNIHVFKPHEVTVRDEEQRKKINELLDKIRLVQEGKASANDVRQVAGDLLATTKTLKDGPDPLSLEELFKFYNVDVKNEVKRQENPEETVEVTTNDVQAFANTTTTTASTEPVDISSTTMTTMTTSPASDATEDGSDFRDALTPAPESSTSSANLLALEESFGGTTRAPDPVLPTKRRNGLYFLVDWNTFLEVGDEDSEKVNLRFEPKVGDRSRFLPVTVP